MYLKKCWLKQYSYSVITQIKQNLFNLLIIIETYFYRFSQSSFTKNPEKYVKYTPAQVSAMLDRFFDVAA